jgi:hypothetical protein
VACSTNRAEALLLSGRADAARPIAQRALELVRSTGEARLIADALVLVGAAECEHGEREVGLQHLREGIAQRRTSGGLRALVDGLCFLIEALVAGGDADAAGDVASELATFDAMTAKYPARVPSTLGLAAAARGDHAAAERYFQSGRRLLQQRVAALDSADAKAYGELTFSRRLTEAATSFAEVGSRSGSSRKRSSTTSKKPA